MIEIKNLTKNFNALSVLKGIDISMPDSGITALLGPNGSGKTTMLKSVLGMVIPDSGEILYNGESVLNQHRYRNTIAYLPQIAQFPENLTGRELIDLFKETKTGATREGVLIDMFDIEKELDKKMGTLSGGNKQKINITLALMHDEPFIILDEPSSGLDPLSISKFKDFLLEEKQRGKLIVITTHIMSLAEELADKIIFILEGKVHYHGSLTALLEMQGMDRLERSIASILEDQKSYV